LILYTSRGIRDRKGRDIGPYESELRGKWRDDPPRISEHRIMRLPDYSAFGNVGLDGSCEQLNLGYIKAYFA